MDGELHVKDFSMKKAIVRFRETLYHENISSSPFIENISYNTISLEDAVELKKEFLREELCEAINDLGKEKVPGQMVLILFFFIIV